MFLGEFEYRVDEKGRIPIPPKFKSELAGGVVLSPGPEKCITGYSISTWSKLAASTNAGNLPNNKERRLNRARFATAFRLPIDGQGRIALPVPLREFAEITDELVITGNNAYFELWNKTEWENEKAASLEQSWQIIESLENR